MKFVIKMCSLWILDDNVYIKTDVYLSNPITDGYFYIAIVPW